MMIFASRQPLGNDVVRVVLNAFPKEQEAALAVAEIVTPHACHWPKRRMNLGLRERVAGIILNQLEE
jgi:hypothetical protein